MVVAYIFYPSIKRSTLSSGTIRIAVTCNTRTIVTRTRTSRISINSTSFDKKKLDNVFGELKTYSVFRKNFAKWNKNEWEKNHSVQDLSKKDILTEVTREKVEKKIAGSLSPVLKGAAELVKMAQKNHVNIKEFLGTEKIICGVENENLENYLKTLKEYVGSNGKYTPLVNYIELKLNNDLLKNVEIVDTPGLDDPIVSREEKTNDFLNKCDVVFLLSNVFLIFPYSPLFIDFIRLLTEQVYYTSHLEFVNYFY